MSKHRLSAVIRLWYKPFYYRFLFLCVGLFSGMQVSAEILMLAQITFQGAPSTTITPPPGWSLLRRDNAGAGPSTANAAIYYRIATADDNSVLDYTFTLNPARRNAAAIAAYDGIDPLVPFGAHAGQTTGGTSSTTITAPSVVAAIDDQIVRLFGHGHGGTDINPPVTGTTRYQTTTSAGPNGSSGLSADITAVVAGATGTLSTTHGSSARNVGQTVILKPKLGSTFSYIGSTTSNSGGPTGGSIVISKPPGVTVPAVDPVDHYAISFPFGNQGSTCAPSDVLITAHDSDHAPVVVSAGTILTLTASAGSWGLLNAGTGSWSNGGSAIETYTWPGGESSFEVQLSRATSGTTTIDLLDNFSRSESAIEDPGIDFGDASIRITDLAGLDLISIGTQIAGKRSDEPPAPQAGQLYIQVFGCTSAITNITNLQMASECNNPGACVAGNQVSILETGGVMKAISAYTDGNALPDTVIDQVFTDQKAPLVLSYPDAGLVSLHMSASVTVCTNKPCTQTQTSTYSGSSNQFVVRPFALSTESADPTLYAVDADGDVFKKAGEDFSVNIRAVAWQAADDDNDDGIQDDGAVLTNNPTTPNFGAGGTATVELSHNLVLPAVPGDPGTLSGGAAISSFSAGIATSVLSFDEVGIIDLVSTSNDYLGATDADIIGTLKNVGRFTPHRFNVTANTPTFANTCTAGANPYTYQDQNFYYQDAPVLSVTALNAAGAITENYGGSGTERFWKLAPILNRDFTDQTVGANDTHLFDSMTDIDVNLSGDTDFDGIGNLSLDNDSDGDIFMYERVVLEAEFDADIDIGFAAASFIDADGVCYDPVNDGSCSDFSISGVSGASLRFGRLLIGNDFGSELLPLQVQFETQYFDGDDFVTNTDDVCTLIDDIDMNSVADIQLSSALETTMSGTVQVCAGGTSSLTLASNPLVMGDAGLSMSAPSAGAGCTGSVDITLDLLGLGLGHLRSDLTDNGLFEDNPVGRATFGVYKGPNEFIYIREPW